MTYFFPEKVKEGFMGKSSQSFSPLMKSMRVLYEGLDRKKELFFQARLHCSLLKHLSQPNADARGCPAEEPY